MKNGNRREFLKKSIAGISGAALLPAGILKAVPGNVLPQLPGRILGRTNIKTPVISMGTAGATSTGFVRAAYEAGIKMFFSANYYGEGNNEILVGDALRKVARDSYIIGTASVPEEMDTRTGLLARSFTADSYMKKTESSLKRFGLDHVDIMLLPYAGKKETVLHEGVLKTFSQVKKQGKTKFVGIISHTDTVEALEAAISSGLYDVAMISYNFTTPDIESLKVVMSKAVKAGMGIIAMKTMAGGGRQSNFNSDAALKWALQNKDVSTIVSGMTSLEELRNNMAMLENLELTSREKADLDLASLPSTEGLYCSQCKQCIPQCPEKLDIPTIMRSYMYAYGYRNTEHAWHTLADAGISQSPCTNCKSCTVQCTSGFDVRKKVTDIVQLKRVPVEFLHS